MNKNTNEKLLETLKAYSLSNTDLDYILNPDTKIITYDKLYNVRHFDEILDKLGRCILLYLTEAENVGHWVGIIKKGNTVEFFDPYGFKPDTQGEKLNSLDHINESMGQNYPRLLELVGDAGYDLVYNKKPLQKIEPGIATCGRHTATRLLFYQLSLEQYQELMKKLKDDELKDVDDVVTKLTFDLLKK